MDLFPSLTFTLGILENAFSHLRPLYSTGTDKVLRLLHGTTREYFALQCYVSSDAVGPAVLTRLPRFSAFFCA